MSEVYKSFVIAGIEYYKALFVINEIKVGDKLILKTEPQNIHDENAVEIYYKDTKLGYIPRNANYSISKIMNAGWDIFDAYVQKIDRDELIIQVAVFVRKR
ncbi:HIRAN domain-containing protein [Caminibacter sp.]